MPINREQYKNLLLDILRDPITLAIMRKPVIANDGRIYDFDTYQRIKHQSPYTEAPILDI
jgi:hypothetical protein